MLLGFAAQPGWRVSQEDGPYHALGTVLTIGTFMVRRWNTCVLQLGDRI
jgi:hypothetical protein